MSAKWYVKDINTCYYCNKRPTTVHKSSATYELSPLCDDCTESIRHWYRMEGSSPKLITLEEAQLLLIKSKL